MMVPSEPTARLQGTYCMMTTIAAIAVTRDINFHIAIATTAPGAFLPFATNMARPLTATSSHAKFLVIASAISAWKPMATPAEAAAELDRDE